MVDELVKKKSHFALVLPGAVARGSFEAGVIKALVEFDVHIDRIVATSSGALNGLAYAAAIRAGRENEMVGELTASWIVNGEWHRSMIFDFWNFIRGRGISGPDRLLTMMRNLVKPCPASNVRRDVELTIVVSPLHGIITTVGGKKATTYEKDLKFSGQDFDSRESLEKVFKAVSAACAFPGLFTPVELEGLGPCIDGGAVNNAPIGCALEENDVNRVIIAVPFPAVMEPAKSLRGLDLLNHLVEILINERLFRDLTLSDKINQDMDKLTALVEKGLLTPEQLELVTSALQVRKVELTQIRPEKVLRQSAFSGFFKKNDRLQLIEEGYRAASTLLNIIPPHNPQGDQTT
jgi:predicted acylesterase/phospholipase RssA